jgi:hypothetical protein
VTAGGVESYLIGFGSVSAVETLPALSAQVPLGAMLAPSGPLYVSEVQLTGPEVASLPLQSIVTGFLYQPFALGAVSGAAELATGGVESYLSANEAVAELPAWSVQVALSAAFALSPVL